MANADARRHAQWPSIFESNRGVPYILSVRSVNNTWWECLACITSRMPHAQLLLHKCTTKHKLAVVELNLPEYAILYDLTKDSFILQAAAAVGTAEGISSLSGYHHNRTQIIQTIQSQYLSNYRYKAQMQELAESVLGYYRSSLFTNLARAETHSPNASFLVECEEHDAGRRMAEVRSLPDEIWRSAPVTRHGAPRISRLENFEGSSHDPTFFPPEDYEDVGFSRGAVRSEEAISKSRAFQEDVGISKFSPTYDLREHLNTSSRSRGRPPRAGTYAVQHASSYSPCRRTELMSDAPEDSSERVGVRYVRGESDIGSASCMGPQNFYPGSSTRGIVSDHGRVSRKRLSLRRLPKPRDSTRVSYTSASSPSKNFNAHKSYCHAGTGPKGKTGSQSGLCEKRFGLSRMKTDGKSVSKTAVSGHLPDREVAKFCTSPTTKLAKFGVKIGSPSLLKLAQQTTCKESTNDETSSSTQDLQSENESASRQPEEKSGDVNGSCVDEQRHRSSDTQHHTESLHQSIPSICKPSFLKELPKFSSKRAGSGLLPQSNTKKLVGKTPPLKPSDVSDFNKKVTALQKEVCSASQVNGALSPSPEDASSTAAVSKLSDPVSSTSFSSSKKAYRLVVLCCRDTADALSPLLQQIPTKFIYSDLLNAASHSEFFALLEAELEKLDSVPCLALLGADVFCDVSLRTCCCSSTCSLEILCCTQLQLFASEFEAKSGKFSTDTETAIKDFISELKCKFDGIFAKTGVLYLFDRPLVTCPIDWSWSTIHRLKKEIPNLRLVTRETFVTLEAYFDVFLRVYNTLLISTNKCFDSDSSHTVMDLVKLRTCVDSNEKVSTSEKMWLEYVENTLVKLGLSGASDGIKPDVSGEKSCGMKTKLDIAADILRIKKEPGECASSPPLEDTKKECALSSEDTVNNGLLRSNLKTDQKCSRTDTEYNSTKMSVVTNAGKARKHSVKSLEGPSKVVKSLEGPGKVVKNEPISNISVKKEPVLFEENASETPFSAAKFNAVTKSADVDLKIVAPIKPENVDDTVSLDLSFKVTTKSVKAEFIEDETGIVMEKQELEFNEGVNESALMEKTSSEEKNCEAETLSCEENAVAPSDKDEVPQPTTANDNDHSSSKSLDESDELGAQLSENEANDTASDDSTFLYEFSDDLITGKKSAEPKASTSAFHTELLNDGQPVDEDEDTDFSYDLNFATVDGEVNHDANSEDTDFSYDLDFATVDGEVNHDANSEETVALLSSRFEPISDSKSTESEKRVAICISERIRQVLDKHFRDSANSQVKNREKNLPSVFGQNSNTGTSQEASVIQDTLTTTKKNGGNDESLARTVRDEESKSGNVCSNTARKFSELSEESSMHAAGNESKSKANVLYFVSNKSITKEKECTCVIAKETRANSPTAERSECVSCVKVSPDGRLLVTFLPEKLPCTSTSISEKDPFCSCKNESGASTLPSITVWGFPRRCPVRIRQAIFLECGAFQCHFTEHKATNTERIRSVFRDYEESERCYRILNGAGVKFNGREWLLSRVDLRHPDADFVSVLSAELHPKPVADRVLSPEEKLADSKLLKRLQSAIATFFSNILVSPTESQAHSESVFETGKDRSHNSDSDRRGNYRSAAKNCKCDRDFDLKKFEKSSDAKAVTPFTGVPLDDSVPVSSGIPIMSAFDVPVSPRKSIKTVSLVELAVSHSEFSASKSNETGFSSTESNDSTLETIRSSTPVKSTSSTNCCELFSTTSNSVFLDTVTTSTWTVALDPSLPVSLSSTTNSNKEELFSNPGPISPVTIGPSHPETYLTSSSSVSNSVLRPDFLKFIDGVSSPSVTRSFPSTSIASSVTSSGFNVTSASLTSSCSTTNSAHASNPLATQIKGVSMSSTNSRNLTLSVPVVTKTSNNGNRTPVSRSSPILQVNSPTADVGTFQAKKSLTALNNESVVPPKCSDTLSSLVPVSNSLLKVDSRVSSDPLGFKSSQKDNECPISVNKIGSLPSISSNTTPLSPGSVISRNDTAQEQSTNVGDYAGISNSSAATSMRSIGSANVLNNSVSQCVANMTDNCSTTVSSSRTSTVQSAMNLLTALVNHKSDDAEGRNNSSSKVASDDASTTPAVPSSGSPTTTTRNVPTIPLVSIPLPPPKLSTYFVSHTSPFVPRTLIRRLVEACDCTLLANCDNGMLKAVVHSTTGESLLLKLPSHLTMFGPVLRITRQDGRSLSESRPRSPLSHVEKTKLTGVFSEGALEVQQRLALFIEKEYDPILFKTRKCSDPKCNRDNCHKYHSLRDRRRNILTHPHQAELCNLETHPATGKCRYGDHCPKSQNRFESLYHPSYLQSLCKRSCCLEHFCPHRHLGTALHVLTSPKPLVYCSGHAHTLFLASAVVRLCSPQAAPWFSPRRDGHTRASPRPNRAVHAVIVLNKSYVHSAFVRSLGDLAREYGVAISQLMEVSVCGGGSVTLVPISKSSTAHEADIVVGTSRQVSCWLNVHSVRAESLRYLVLEYSDNDMLVRSVFSKLRLVKSLTDVKTVVVGEHNSTGYRSDISTLFWWQHLESAPLDDGLLKLCASIARPLDENSSDFKKQETRMETPLPAATAKRSPPTKTTSPSDGHKKSNNRSSHSKSSSASRVSPSKKQEGAPSLSQVKLGPISTEKSGTKVVCANAVQTSPVALMSSESKPAVALPATNEPIELQSEKKSSADVDSCQLKQIESHNLSKFKSARNLRPVKSSLISKLEGDSTDDVFESIFNHKPPPCSSLNKCPPHQKSVLSRDKQKKANSNGSEIKVAQLSVKRKSESIERKQSSIEKKSFSCRHWDDACTPDVKQSIDRKPKALHVLSPIKVNAVEKIIQQVAFPNCVSTNLCAVQNSKVGSLKTSNVSSETTEKSLPSKASLSRHSKDAPARSVEWNPEVSDHVDLASIVSPPLPNGKVPCKNSEKPNVLVSSYMSTPPVTSGTDMQPNASHCEGVGCVSKPCSPLLSGLQLASEARELASSQMQIKNHASENESTTPMSYIDLTNVTDTTLDTEDSLSDCEKRNGDLLSRTEPFLTEWCNLPEGSIVYPDEVLIENEDILFDSINVNSSYLNDSNDSEDCNVKKPIHEKIRRVLSSESTYTNGIAGEKESILPSNTLEARILPNSQSERSVDKVFPETTNSGPGDMKKNDQPRLENHSPLSAPGLTKIISPSDAALTSIAVTSVVTSLPASTLKTGNCSRPVKAQILSKETSVSPLVSQFSNGASRDSPSNVGGRVSEHRVSRDVSKPFSGRSDRFNRKSSWQEEVKVCKGTKKASCVEVLPAVHTASASSNNMESCLTCQSTGVLETNSSGQLLKTMSTREAILASLVRKKLNMVSGDQSSCEKISEKLDSKGLASDSDGAFPLKSNENITLRVSSSVNVETQTNDSDAIKKTEMGITTSTPLDHISENATNQKFVRKFECGSKFEALAQILLDGNVSANSESPDSTASSQLPETGKRPCIEDVSKFQPNQDECLPIDEGKPAFKGIESSPAKQKDYVKRGPTDELATTENFSNDSLKSAEVFSGKLSPSKSCEVLPEIKHSVRTSKKTPPSEAQNTHHSSPSSNGKFSNEESISSSKSTSCETKLSCEIMTKRNSKKKPSSSLFCSGNSLPVNRSLIPTSPLEVSTGKRPIVSKHCSPKKRALSDAKLASNNKVPSKKVPGSTSDKRSMSKTKSSIENILDAKLNAKEISTRELSSNKAPSASGIAPEKLKFAVCKKEPDCISDAYLSDQQIPTMKKSSSENISKKHNSRTKSSSSKKVISEKRSCSESIPSKNDLRRNSQNTHKTSSDKLLSHKDINVSNQTSSIELLKQNITTSDKSLGSVDFKNTNSSSQNIAGKKGHSKTKSSRNSSSRVKSQSAKADVSKDIDRSSQRELSTKLKAEISLSGSPNERNSCIKVKGNNSIAGITDAQVSLGKNKRSTEQSQNKIVRSSAIDASACKTLSSTKHSSRFKSSSADSECTKKQSRVSERKKAKSSALPSENKVSDASSNCREKLVASESQRKPGSHLEFIGNVTGHDLDKARKYGIDSSVKSASTTEIEKSKVNSSDLKVSRESELSESVIQEPGAEKKCSSREVLTETPVKCSENSRNLISAEMLKEIESEFTKVKEFLEPNSMNLCVNELFEVYVNTLVCYKDTGDQETLKKAVNQLRSMSGREASRIAESEYVEFLKAPDSSPNYESERRNYALLEDTSVPWEAFWRRKMELVREEKILKLKRSLRRVFRSCHEKCLAIISEEKFKGGLKVKYGVSVDQIKSDEKEMDTSLIANEVGGAKPGKGKHSAKEKIRKNSVDQVKVICETHKHGSKSNGGKRKTMNKTELKVHQINHQEQINAFQLEEQNVQLVKQNDLSIKLASPIFKSNIQAADDSNAQKLKTHSPVFESENSTKRVLTEKAGPCKKRLKTESNNLTCKSNVSSHVDQDSRKNEICVPQEVEAHANDENAPEDTSNSDSNFKRQGEKRTRRSSNKENSHKRSRIESKSITPVNMFDLNASDHFQNIEKINGSERVSYSSVNSNTGVPKTVPETPKIECSSDTHCESNTSIKNETSNAKLNEKGSLQHYSTFSSIEAASSFGIRHNKAEVVAALEKASRLIDELSVYLLQLASSVEKGKTLSFDDEPETRMVLECARDRLQFLGLEEQKPDEREELANAALVLGNCIVASTLGFYREITTFAETIKHTHGKELFIGRSGLRTSLSLKLGVSTKDPHFNVEDLAKTTEHCTAEELWRAVKAAVDKQSTNAGQTQGSANRADYASVFMEVSSIHALRVLHGKSM